MKILALSDKVVSHLQQPSIKERYEDVDLVVGCGDLPARYLEFILTVLNVPLAYVPGNHDRDDVRVPGGVSADGRMVHVAGIRVLGLGGSMRYKPRGRHQYTESEMRARVLGQLPKLVWRRWRKGRAFDVLLSHAPPRGIHDAEDQAHLGFEAFLWLMRMGRPKLMLHGHTHAIRNLEVTETQYEDTQIVNVYPYRVVELPKVG